MFLRLGIPKAYRLFIFAFTFVLSGSLLWADSLDRGEPKLQFPLDFNLVLNQKNFPEDIQVSYRYHSFGNTRLKIKVVPSKDFIDESKTSHILIKKESDHKERFFKEVSPGASSSKKQLIYHVELEKSGNYLLVVPKSHDLWNVECVAGCGRPELSLAEFIRGLQPEELRVFSEKLTQFLKLNTVPGEEMQKLVSQVTQVLSKKDGKALARFPTLPSVNQLNLLRPYLSKFIGKKKAGSENSLLPAQWEDVIASNEFTSYPKLQAVDPKLPNIGYGHFVSESVPLKMMAQNLALSSVMTALAEQKGYELSFPFEGNERMKVTQLNEFLELLWATGHHIELRDERTFANFLSYARGEKYIRWPVWFKTQIQSMSGDELLLPAPHSQFVWQVTGPVVNARVNFFLGISGVGFFPKFDEERPQWTGLAHRFQIFDNSPQNRAIIKKATRYAELYLRRIRKEAQLYAKDYPSDGYAYVGICNDSSAVIESAISSEVSFFPLFRSPQLFKVPKIYDGLEDILESLPQDSQPIKAQIRGTREEEDYYRRIMSMVSYPYDPNYLWDEKFFEQIQELAIP